MSLGQLLDLEAVNEHQQEGLLHGRERDRTLMSRLKLPCTFNTDDCRMSDRCASGSMKHLLNRRKIVYKRQ